MWEKTDLLHHITSAPSQLERIPRLRRPRFNDHLTRIRHEQTVDQFKDCALARAASADERERVSGGNLEREAAQNRLSAAREVDVAKSNRAGSTGIVHGSTVLHLGTRFATRSPEGKHDR